ncbi:MAG: hypothetical protein ACFFCQ_08955 [Promethearchaeota archaeon]
MFKKNLKDLLSQLGYLDEIDDETLNFLIRQIYEILDSGLGTNAISIKTGCILHQITISNNLEVKETLKRQILEGLPKQSLRLSIQLSALCLYLEEDATQCSIIKAPCTYKTSLGSCEIVRNSLEANLEDWK